MGGAMVDAKSVTERTALICASEQGHTGVVRVLLEAGRQGQAGKWGRSIQSSCS